MVNWYIRVTRLLGPGSPVRGKWCFSGHLERGHGVYVSTAWMEPAILAAHFHEVWKTCRLSHLHGRGYCESLSDASTLPPRDVYHTDIEL